MAKFHELSKKAQAAYLKAHPNSKYHKGKSTSKRKAPAKRSTTQTARSRRAKLANSYVPTDIINGHHYDMKTGKLLKSSDIFTIGKNGKQRKIKPFKSLSPQEYLARRARAMGR